MDNTTIVIPNFNSFEAIQLCIESIRYYTVNPQIIVRDDASWNDDVVYLRECRDKGWIRLIEGEKRLEHGGSLDVILNSNIIKTDYAVIVDCDVEIISPDWLGFLLSHMKDNKDLLTVGIEYPYCQFKTILAWFQGWMMALNMKAYRDGMQINWNIDKINGVFYPMGAKLWIKVQHDNPKNYRIVPLSKEMENYYRHIAHWSCLSMPTESDGKDHETARQSKRKQIQEACRAFREKKKRYR